MKKQVVILLTFMFLCAVLPTASCGPGGFQWVRQCSAEDLVMVKVTAINDHCMWASGMGAFAKKDISSPNEPQVGDIYFFDGSSWERQLEVDAALFDIYALDVDKVWAAGGSEDGLGCIYFFDGAEWSNIYETTGFISGITATGMDHVWALNVYEQGFGKSASEIIFFDGSDWNTQFETEDMLTAISSCDSEHAWAVGDKGIYCFDGDQWNMQQGTDGRLLCIYALDPSHVWAAGYYQVEAAEGIPEYIDRGIMYFFDGSDWEEQLDLEYEIKSIFAMDSEHVWASGQYYAKNDWNEEEEDPYSAILFNDGNSWREIYRTEDAVNSLTALDVDTIVAVGDGIFVASRHRIPWAVTEQLLSPGSAAESDAETDRRGMRITLQTIEPYGESEMEAAVAVIESRLDAMYIEYYEVRNEGTESIIVEMPRVKSPEDIVDLITNSGDVQFREVLEIWGSDSPEYDQAEIIDLYALDTRRYEELTDQEVTLGYSDEDHGITLAVRLGPTRLTGDSIEAADAAVDEQQGGYKISFSLTDEATPRFAALTEELVGKQLAIVVGYEIVSFPNISHPITDGRGDITGDFTRNEAREVAFFLKMSYLRLPVRFKKDPSVQEF